MNGYQQEQPRELNKSQRRGVLNRLLYSTLGIHGDDGVLLSCLPSEFKKDWREPLDKYLTNLGYEHLFDFLDELPDMFGIDAECSPEDPIIYAIYNPENAHLLENFNSEPRKRFENKYGEKAPKSVQRWFCEVCQATLTNEEQYQLHLVGKNHAKKLRQQEESMKGSSKYFCDICKASATDDNQWRLHLQGKQHLKKLQQCPPAKCTVCDIYLRDETSMFHPHRDGIIKPSLEEYADEMQKKSAKQALAAMKMASGVIVAELGDRFIICTNDYMQEPFLMFEDLNGKEEPYLGAWVQFSVYCCEDGKKKVTEYKLIDDKLPTRLIKVELEVPDDYEPFNYDGKIPAEFVKTAYDYQSLYVPKLHDGKAIKAVVEYGTWPNSRCKWAIKKILVS